MFKNPGHRLDCDTDFIGTGIGRTLAEEPIGIIDIGARDGVHAMFDPLGKLAAVLAFEPDPQGYLDLLGQSHLWDRFGKVVVLEKALGDGRELPFYVMAKPTNNSLLPVNTDFVERYRMELFRPAGEGRVATHRLDEIVFAGSHGIARAGEIIKIDTQGSELLIFEHAARTLDANTIAVIAEVWFCEIYRGQPLFHDIAAQMARHGLAFYGFTEMFLRSGKRVDKTTALGRERALYADAIFVKDPFDCPGQSTTDRHFAVLFAFALLTQYFDLALEIAERRGGSDSPALYRLVRRLAAADVEGLAAEARQMADHAAVEPARANVVLGKFADRWRGFFDFQDQK